MSFLLDDNHEKTSPLVRLVASAPTDVGCDDDPPALEFSAGRSPLAALIPAHARQTGRRWHRSVHAAALQSLRGVLEAPKQFDGAPRARPVEREILREKARARACKFDDHMKRVEKRRSKNKKEQEQN